MYVYLSLFYVFETKFKSEIVVVFNSSECILIILLAFIRVKQVHSENVLF